MIAQSYLVVDAIENLLADNGRKFQKITFSEQKMLPGNRIMKTRNTRTRNVWDVSTDGKVKADSYYNALRVGDIVEGSVVRFDTTPYTVGERTVETWSGVIFSDENPVTYANSQLKTNNASVIDADGNVTGTSRFVDSTPEPTPATVEDSKF